MDADKTIVNVGEQRFDKIIGENKFYIDKTGFIREWWETGATVTLITRPRRFGNTLNMSMVECFFSNRYTDRGYLFEGLSIWVDTSSNGLVNSLVQRGTSGIKQTPERFFHGFVLGLMVELAGRFRIKSNRESGFGRYDVMLVPADRKKDCAYIIEFKVHKSLKEQNLEETVANARAQIEKKQYEAELISEGFIPGQIRKYGFAFQEKIVS